MSLQELKQECKAALSNQYESIELNSLMAILFEHITGWDQLKQVLNKETELSQEKIKEFHEALNLLREGMPIQYIIGKAWFMGNEFIVNENVLIPRPETEELVEWIIEYATIINKPLQILDIGTGSGCIPIALKLALPHCMLAGLDISEKALLTAKQNADTLKTKISWIQEDILNTTYLLNQFDVIVSNPPYIPFKENINMQAQVKNFEPNIALFVKDEDPLIFYRTIARLGKQYLQPNGQLFFEIHYDQGKALLSLFDEMGYHAELRQDMFGKDRMLRASLKKGK
ncbi:MAG: peptide chain release factor N(5)-glutamine methyltransferase [Bacteroidota bacterium]|jgi:release factor glutamine methyltransferase